MFSVEALFNDKINNHFHYDYQKVIDEVSRINGRDMTQELVESGYLRPLPHGEYEINLQDDTNTIRQRDKKNLSHKLYNNNKAVIEKVMEMPYEHFLGSRNRLETMKKMEQPITQKYLDDSLLNSHNAEETQNLLKAGADVNARNEYGETPLMHAHTAEQTKMLIEADIDINAKDEFGKNALSYARTVG